MVIIPRSRVYALLVAIVVISSVLLIYTLTTIQIQETNTYFSHSNQKYTPNINNINIYTDKNNLNINVDSSMKNNFNIHVFNDTKYSSTKIYVPELRNKFKDIYENYIQFHTKTLADEQKGKKGKYMFVNFDNPYGTNGLGNKFPVYVTGLVMALIMKRTLVVNYFGKEKLMDMIDPGFELEIPSWLDLASRSRKTIDLSEREYNIATDNDLTTFFADYDVVELTTNDYPLVLLYGNPLYYDWLIENFGINPYSIIAKHLFRPSPKLQAIVDDFKSKYFGKYTIGIQVRTEKLYVKEGSKVFTEIAQWIKGIRFTKDTRFFIATDSEVVRKEAKQELGEYLVMVEPYKERFSPDSEFYAVVDINLLGSCDVIVMSFTSSFGAISISLEGTETYMVYPDGTFAKLSIREPCFFSMRNVFQKMEEKKDTRNRNNPFFLAQLKCHS